MFIMNEMVIKILTNLLIPCSVTLFVLYRLFETIKRYPEVKEKGQSLPIYIGYIVVLCLAIVLGVYFSYMAVERII